MIQRKAFKFQLKTNDAQAQEFRQFAGCCRLVWNKALALQKERLEQKQEILNYSKLAGVLVQWKHSEELGFLSECASQPLQQALKNLDKALWDAFDKKIPNRFPRFKKKGIGDRFDVGLIHSPRIVRGFQV